MTYDDLVQAQADLEAYGKAVGAQKYLKAAKVAIKQGDLTKANPSVALIEEALPKTISALKQWLDSDDQLRGERRAAREALRLFPVEKSALTGLSCAFVAVSYSYLDASRTENALVAVTRKIANAMTAQVWAHACEQNNPELYRRLLLGAKKMDARFKGRFDRVRMKAVEAGYDPEPLSPQMAASLAEPILDAVLACGMFVVKPIEPDYTNTIFLTPEAEDAVLQGLTDGMEWARPFHLPMVVEPLKWTAMKSGGYLGQHHQKSAPLMTPKDWGHYKLVSRALERGEVRQFINALDVLQRTPLAINGEVVDAAEVARANGWRARKMPENQAPDLPEVPEGIEAWEEDRRKEFWRGFYQARNMQREVIGGSVVWDETIRTARMMAAYPAFYLPHFIDRRGRVYPRPSFSHHRADYVRGMITLAEGSPLGDHGKRWLAIHIANNAAGDAYGKLDKLPFDERVGWVMGNRDLIHRVAREWRDCPDLWATVTDNPFQFLAGCLEWVRCEAAATGDTWGEVCSSLPVGLDGTCSGLQHYGAALRSPFEGRLVNLMASDRPQDVYGAVAETVRANITAELSSDDPATASLARAWVDYGISRGTVKRQVMTYVYGSAAFGFMRQIMADLMRPLERDVILGKVDTHAFGGDKGKAAASYMAKHVYAAIGAVVPAAAAGMDWFKAEAGLLAKHGKHMYWRSPLRLPIIHRYTEAEIERVNLFLVAGGVAMPHRETVEGEEFRVRANFAVGGKKLLVHKQVSAAAPNVIHSMDAAHLQLTALACASQDVPHLLMIHDSFATTAGKTEDLARILREEFVKMYEGYDIFHEIRRQSLKVLPEEAHADLKPLPEKGSLDLSEVLRSPYFFG